MDTNTSASSFLKQFKGSSTRERASTSFGALPTFLVVRLTILAVCYQVTCADRSVLAASSKNLDQSDSSLQQHDLRREPQNGALEAELNSIVQQHDALDINNKQLAEAIISRLMLDNLTGSNLMSGGSEQFENDIAPESGESFGQDQASELSVSEQAGPTGPEAIRLRKLINVLHNYQASLANGGSISGGLALIPYPILPNSQAATMKRAAMKMGNLLQQQKVSPYARQNYDFGLGKRPDSGISGNILRYGDSALGGQIQPVSQFGKRPSSHRYDFGLGKRVASPAYPRYDFGLGKRAPSRIRYDFGLGK